MNFRIKTDTKPGAIIIEGHIQGLSNTRSLGKAGIPVYVVDKNMCIAQYSIYCKKFFICPDFINDSFADFLIHLAKKEALENWVLIPSNDHAVYTISKNKKKLESIFRIITPDLEIIKNIYDKVNLIRIAESNNIPVPKTQVFTSIDEFLEVTLKFPILIKGRNGLSFYKSIGKKALICNNKIELARNLAKIEKTFQISDTFSQELIPYSDKNKTISFTAFCVNGEIKTHWTGIKLREHPIQFGTATFTKNTYVEECHINSEKLLKALNFNGVCEIEYLRDSESGEYKLIEINPRTWLWVGLAKASGVDYAKLIYDYMNDYPIDFPKAKEDIYYWINPVTDSIYSLISIFLGKLNSTSYIKSIFLKNKINALYSKGDMKPMYAYLFLGFSFIKRR